MALREKFNYMSSYMTAKLTLIVTLTLTDTVKLISQTKLGGELLREPPNLFHAGGKYKDTVGKEATFRTQSRRE